KENVTAEDIEEVKRLISQMGVLEFRILANGPDDQAGIVDSHTAIRAAADRQVRSPVNPNDTVSDLTPRASRGLPPEGPTGEFNVDIADTKAKVRYVWVELGPEERESLGLSNASENTGGLWMMASLNRDKAFAVGHGPGGYTMADNQTAGMLLFSRKCIS